MMLVAQGLTFDWTISLGQIVNAVLLVAGFGFAVLKLYHALDKRVTIFERDMNGHARTLQAHAAQMDRWAPATTRLDELERWRLVVRQDMHEISEMISNVMLELKRLAVIIEERTERRGIPRQGE